MDTGITAIPLVHKIRKPDTERAATHVVTTRFVALLRGINVGGKNKIAMADLVSSFETHGFEDVATYIQSGNVVFSAAASDRAELTRSIEAMLSEAFDYTARVTLRSRDELGAIVGDAPAGFGTRPDTFRYDVIFLIPPLTAEAAMDAIELREGVDEACAGNGVVYHSRLIERASQSRLTKIVGTPIYQQMTIRNWNTTTRLLTMMDPDGAGAK